MRKQLITHMGIAYQLIEHSTDETVEQKDITLIDAVRMVAKRKMDSVVISETYNYQTAYILTADTLGADAHGRLYGKPVDRQQAREFLHASQGTNMVATAFCLHKREKINAQWQLVQEKLVAVQTIYEFDMPDIWIERYLDNVPQALSASAALTIEGFGAQFMRSINGSYTAILGLPVYELRVALEQIGYFF